MLTLNTLQAVVFKVFPFNIFSQNQNINKMFSRRLLKPREDENMM